MIKFVRFSGLLALAVFCCSVASAQAQEPQRYSRDTCVKVKEGKWEEYTAYQRDVSTKLAKVRVEEGAYASYALAQAVVPTGRSARCDYHIVVGYLGFPPEAPGPEKLAADMKKAGIAMSREAMFAKRDQLVDLVGVDIWQWRERVGAMPEKGSYARLNFYKIKPGMTNEWVRSESTGWKPLAEAAAKEHGTSWRAATLAMPGGANLPYNAMTVDGFPSWAAVGQGLPARAIWNKVHPNMDMTAYMDRLATIVDRPRIDVVKLIEVMGK